MMPLAHRVFGDAAGAICGRGQIAQNNRRAARHTVMNVSITVVADNDPDPGESQGLIWRDYRVADWARPGWKDASTQPFDSLNESGMVAAAFFAFFRGHVYPTNYPVYRQISRDRRTITNPMIEFSRIPKKSRFSNCSSPPHRLA
jgi:hypothetical protein